MTRPRKKPARVRRYKVISEFVGVKMLLCPGSDDTWPLLRVEEAGHVVAAINEPRRLRSLAEAILQELDR